MGSKVRKRNGEAKFKSVLWALLQSYQKFYEELQQLRSENPPTLIAVSKFQPFEKFNEAFGCGVVHFGENRIQEGIEKFSQWLKDKNTSLVLHHIGPVQSGTLRM